MKSFLQSIALQLRRIFCRHDWQVSCEHRCAVMRSDGIQEGSMTILELVCPKCGAERLEIFDRTHFLKPESEPTKPEQQQPTQHHENESEARKTH